MSLQACADIVLKGDPDRFAAAMAAPVEARRVLFPLYAFNVEVSRAPWVTSEPMIGEMRLQWWRDALEEMAEGRVVRRHEVTAPMAEVMDAEGAAALDAVVEVRRWDLYTDPFADEMHFNRYIGAGGTLMWTAARLLGATADTAEPIAGLGRAAALARYLQAVPELEARGRIPLLDGRAETVKTLAAQALEEYRRNTDVIPSLNRMARSATFEAWQARPILGQVVQDPGRVGAGSLGQSAFRKKLSLLLKAF